MKFSSNQQRAINKIQAIAKSFGKDRWFTQGEVIGAGYKTLMALVNKGYLEMQHFSDLNELPYYRLSESNRK